MANKQTTRTAGAMAAKPAAAAAPTAPTAPTAAAPTAPTAAAAAPLDYTGCIVALRAAGFTCLPLDGAHMVFNPAAGASGVLFKVYDAPGVCKAYTSYTMGTGKAGVSGNTQGFDTLKWRIAGGYNAIVAMVMAGHVGQVALWADFTARANRYVDRTSKLSIKRPYAVELATAIGARAVAAANA